MRVLFDISHPAHVHFFKNVISSLNARGHATHVVARKKDVTLALLDRLRIPHEVTGQSGKKSRLLQAKELIERDFALARTARRFGADMIVTRNPAGAQVGRLLGIRSIFDTDDGRAAGVHFWSAAPFAHIITTPDCVGENYGRRHVQYRGYKQLAYLHPNHFKPDRRVRDELGVKPGERLFILRFVENVASHDVAEKGLPLAAQREIVARLRRHGRVFATHERALPAEFAELQFPLTPDRLHDALAVSDLVVGDSQSVAAESAVLGTPSIRICSWAGRLNYLEDLEHRYQLTHSYLPEQIDRALAHLDRLLALPDLRGSVAAAHQRLLAEKIDVADWLVRFIEAGAPQS